jgi:membrane-associated protease RseP (regulator of RpoE activity)
MNRSYRVGSSFAMALLLQASPCFGQDFLKQLEAKLRGKPPAAKEEVPSSSEPQSTDRGGADGKGSDSPNPGGTQTVEPRTVVEEAEELPMPGANASSPTTASSGAAPSATAPMRLEPPSGRSNPPVVISPRKKPTPPAPEPSLSFGSGMQLGSTPQPGNPVDGATIAMEPAGGGYLGLTLEPAIGGGFGLAVVDVTPQSPAWKAGFRLGDRVIGVAGQAVTTIDQFAEELEKLAPGTPVRFLVHRRGRSTNIVAVLQDRTLAGQIQGAVPGTALPLQPPVAAYQPLSGNVPPNANVFLGVSVSDLSEPFRQQFGIAVYRGAAVSNVVVGSAAEAAGIQPGDCIVELDGRMILRGEDVVEVLRGVPAGQSITISYFRGRQRFNVQVPLIAGPASVQSNVNAMRASGISPDMLTPEYVASLHDEVARLQEQLFEMQQRLRELEASPSSSDRRR